MMRDLIAELGDGRLRPLPVRVFAFGEAQDAFRFMAQARHVGKLVLRAPQVGLPRLPGNQLVRSDATYLVTGGLGALGLRTAEWLVALARGTLC